MSKRTLSKLSILLAAAYMSHGPAGSPMNKRGTDHFGGVLLLKTPLTICHNFRTLELPVESSIKNLLLLITAFFKTTYLGKSKTCRHVINTKSPRQAPFSVLPPDDKIHSLPHFFFLNNKTNHESTQNWCPIVFHRSCTHNCTYTFMTGHS